MEQAMAAFCQKLRKGACGEFGTAVPMTVVLSAMLTVTFSFVMIVGADGIGVDFSIKNGFALAALQIISVAVLRAAGAFIYVFHGNSPRDDGYGVCVDGAPWDTAAPSR